MGSYQERALDGASAVDLVVALYDGIIASYLPPKMRCNGETKATAALL
jgi:hypothetical protein